MAIPINDQFGRRNNIQVPLTAPEDVQVDFLSVPDITSRDNIASFRRRPLMVVRVKDDGLGTTRFYELQPDLTTWTEDNGFGSGDFIETSEKGAANGVAPLNADGKINEQYLNSLFINSTTGVADIAAMLAITSTTGDVFVVEDASADPNVPSGSAVYYKINNDDPAALDDFLRLDFGAQVLSVNGETGVVTITITGLIDSDLSGFNDRVTNSSYGTTTTAAIAQNTLDIAANASTIAAVQASIEDEITEFDSAVSYDVGDIVYAQDGAKNRELFLSIQTNAATSVGPYDGTGSTYWARFGEYYLKSEIDTLLSSKADLVGGVVDDSQLNSNILRSTDLESNLTDDASKVASSKGARDYADAAANQAEADAITYVDTNFDTSAEVDTKISNAISNASQGITGEFVDISARDAANTIINGERWSVLSEGKVYEFTGVLGQSGASFWDFVYTLGGGGGTGVFEPVQDITELKAIDTTDVGEYPDKWTILVEDEGSWYRLDRDSAISESLPEIVTPTTGTGRWIRMTSDTLLTTNKIIYVSKQGNNSNPGNIINAPKLTIQAAIDAATAGDTVEVLDGEVYSESIVTKEDVNIYAENASLDLSSGRSLTLNEGYIRFKRVFRTSGSNTMITTTGIETVPRGYCIIDFNELDDSGTGISIENTNGSKPLDIRIKQVYVRNENILLVDSDGTGSHSHVSFDDLYLYSANCIGISLTGGGSVVGNIQHIKELGAGVGSSTAFDIDNGEINIVAPDARATTIADIETNGSFRFTSQRFLGDVLNNGGQYSYITMGDDNGNMKLSTNLDIELDSSSITLPQQAANAGAFLTVGTGGLINYTNLLEPGSEWTDDTEVATTVNNTTETIVYSVTVDADADQGSISYVLNYTPGFFMNVTARLRRTDVNGTIIDSRSFNGSGAQTLSYSLPLSSLTVQDGDTFVLTIQFASANPGNTVNDGGFLTIVKSGTLIQDFSSITGDPLTNTSLNTLFGEKVDKDGGDSQLIHVPEDDDNSTGFFAGLLTLKSNTALLLKTALDRIVSFIKNEVFKVSDFPVSGIGEGESQVPIITKTAGVPAIGTPLALENLFIAPTNLTNATFTNGRATATGIPGQRSQDTDWQYLCIGINEWTRYPIFWDKKEILTVAGADRTPAQLVSDYPNAIAGMWVIGINYAYLCTGVNTWKRIAIENTW